MQMHYVNKYSDWNMMPSPSNFLLTKWQMLVYAITIS